MPEICTCGAQLPPEALFCHKCGKPQREVGPEEPETPETSFVSTPPAFPATPPVAAAEPEPQPAPQVFQAAAPTTPSFRDRATLRVALWVGVGATILGLTLPLVNWLAAGFFSVFFYRRRTHRAVNVSGGVQMGWITGLVMFPMWAVAFVPEALSGRLGAAMEQQVKTLSVQDPAVQQQMMQFFQSGAGIATMILISVVFMFLLSVALSIAGGALGAKLVGRD
jgi:hypothetical protein